MELLDVEGIILIGGADAQEAKLRDILSRLASVNPWPCDLPVVLGRHGASTTSHLRVLCGSVSFWMALSHVDPRVWQRTSFDALIGFDTDTFIDAVAAHLTFVDRPPPRYDASAVYDDRVFLEAHDPLLLPLRFTLGNLHVNSPRMHELRDRRGYDDDTAATWCADARSELELTLECLA